MASPAWGPAACLANATLRTTADLFCPNMSARTCPNSVFREEVKRRFEKLAALNYVGQQQAWNYVRIAMEAYTGLSARATCSDWCATLLLSPRNAAVDPVQHIQMRHMSARMVQLACCSVRAVA